MTVGHRIRAARESAKMTQDELGALCGTTKQTIFKYETGVITNIPLDRLEKIAEVLGISPNFLTGWDAPPQKETPADQKASGLYSTNYSKLTPENRDMIDDLIDRLLKSQSAE